MEREMSMAMAPRLALDRGYITRPSGSMSSILFLTASKASKMLVTAASAAAVASGERETWRPVDNVRYLVMLTAWVNVWILRVLMDIFSCSSVESLLDGDVRGLLCGEGGSSTALILYGGIGNGPGWSSTTAIGRALSHILRILNEIPATSRKYEFMLAMADRIISENLQNRLLPHVRTPTPLPPEVRGRASATWPSCVRHVLPLGPRLATWYDAIRLCVADTWRSSKSCRHVAVTSPSSYSNEWLEAEKLAQELLRITNKMRACSAAGEAIVQWGLASGLASVSLTAHPRVQGPIVKISAVLLREPARGDQWEAPREVRFRILALWLPLLCYASNGVTCPVLMGLERWEMERVVEDLISGLPWEDQEVILGNWLEDFAAADSDWPNLQRCFDRWCRHSRSLLF